MEAWVLEHPALSGFALGAVIASAGLACALIAILAETAGF